MIKISLIGPSRSVSYPRHSIDKFLIPCIMEYVNFTFSVCCFRCQSYLCSCCFSDMRHVDRRFPASPKSLGGSFEGDSDVEWMRASDIVKAEALKERAAQQQQQPRLGAEAAEAAGAADSPRVVEHLFEDRIEPGE